nr:MAG TPA: hypothetical protein [Caudoviricetes sp.]
MEIITTNLYNVTNSVKCYSNNRKQRRYLC